MPYMTASSFLGVGKEVTPGTGVAPTVYLPIDSPQWEPKLGWLPDDGMRGSPVEVYGNVAGVRHDEFGVKGKVFLDTLPILLLMLLGGPDTKTGSSPSYTHTIPLLNAPSTGSQPPSYSLADYDGTNTAKRLAGAKLDTLSFDFGVDSAFSWDAKFLAYVASSLSIPTPSFSTEVFVPSWNCSASLGGSVSAVVAAGTLEAKRSTTPIHTLGQQGPYAIFVGPLAVSGKLTMVYEASSGPTQLAAALAATKQVLELAFTDPTSGHSTTWTMSKVQLEDPSISRGKTYVELEVSYEAEANATDAVTGYAPMTTATVNAVSSAF